MYIPNAFREDEIEKLVAFRRANSFATLVSILNCQSKNPQFLAVGRGEANLEYCLISFGHHT
ncbi:FMN-binding negative transcriptional regulator [Nostoc sp.]|uniref:FMN-binding negative transcriptional regulator n=1 Tax=Nostoc sp. TaxID=1180 RepID=UPI002FFA5494